MNDFHAEMPHAPAPPEPRHILPEGPLLVRGIGLAAVAAGSAWLGVNAVRRSWILAPVGLVLAATSLLAAWAAAIHLTGGEKFDDHPFV